MIELVTIEEARAHLRIDDVDSDGSPDDLWLAIFIPAISEAVANWLKDEWRLYVAEVDSGGVVVDASGDPVPAVPLVARPVVKAATLIELSYQFRYREGEGDHTATGDLYGGRYGYTLSRGATALLASLRKSTVA